MSSIRGTRRLQLSRLPVWYGCGLALALIIAGGVTWQRLARSASASPSSVKVSRTNIETSVTALGTLQPRRYVDVGAQVSGQIMRLHAQPGDTLGRGDLLVEIDPNVQQAAVDADRASLKALQAQLVDLTAQRKLASVRYARLRLLSGAGAASLDDLQSAEATLTSAGARIDQVKALIAQTRATLQADAARLGYTRIYAPMAGTVVSVDAREGQTLNATYQTPTVLRIADLTSMTVWSEVSEADVGKVKPGMPAYFSTLGNDGRRWEGKVRQILPSPPVANSVTASNTAQAAGKVVVYTVLFDVDNSDAALMPQMTAQVTFVQQRVKDALTVPTTALSPVEGSQDRFTVQVLHSNGEVERRQVRIGAHNRFVAQVLEGLQTGDAVLTSGSPPDASE